MTLLSAQALHITYPGRHGAPPARAVDGVRLDIDAGEIVPLVGASARHAPAPRPQDRPMPPPHVPATQAARNRP